MEGIYYLLQETKLEGNVVEVVKQVWGGRWISHDALEANGRGIILLWDEKGLGTVRCLKLAHTLSYASLNHNSKILNVTQQMCTYQTATKKGDWYVKNWAL